MPDEDPIRKGLQAPTPTLRELAMVLFRQRRVFVCVSGLVLVAAIIYAFAGTKYQANMKILVRRGRADAPVSAQADAPLDLTRMEVTEEELNSEVELLRDDEVLRKVAETNRMGGRDWFHIFHMGDGHAEQVERAARRLAKKLQVEAVKKTNLIAVSYAADDPQQAAKVLQSVANAYLEKHRVVHRPSGEFTFFDQQRGESRLQLEEAKGKLLQFTDRHRVVSAAQQRDLALQKLSDVDANERQTRVDLAETQQRVNELEGQLAKMPERTTTQVRIADNPELLKALKSSLLDLQLKRTQLLTKFEPNHRLVQEVDQQITQAEATIASENTLPLRDETTDKNVHYEWGKSELQRAQVQLRGLQAREAAIAVQEGAYQAMARRLGEDAITQDDLLSTEKAAQENYLLYVKKEEEARMGDALDQTGIVNVAIAESPVAPALPVWSAWMVFAFGVVGAGVSGTGAAFLADNLDPAFRNPDDVLAYLNAPVLASLPRASRGRLSA
jgi:protein tyrosine kinase modulator